jgi:hypothetical protein
MMMNIDYSHRVKRSFASRVDVKWTFRKAHFTSTEDRWRENVISSGRLQSD